MAISTATLQTMRDALFTAMMSGTKTVQFADRLVSYQSVSEMKSALATLDGEIAASSGSGRRIRRRLVAGVKAL